MTTSDCHSTPLLMHINMHQLIFHIRSTSWTDSITLQGVHQQGCLWAANRRPCHTGCIHIWELGLTEGSCNKRRGLIRMQKGAALSWHKCGGTKVQNRTTTGANPSRHSHKLISSVSSSQKDRSTWICQWPLQAMSIRSIFSGSAPSQEEIRLTPV